MGGHRHAEEGCSKSTSQLGRQQRKGAVAAAMQRARQHTPQLGQQAGAAAAAGPACATHLPGPLAGLTMTSRRGASCPSYPCQQQVERRCVAACAAASSDSSCSASCRMRRLGLSASRLSSGACQMVSSLPLVLAPTMSAAAICSDAVGVGGVAQLKQGRRAGAGTRQPAIVSRDQQLGNGGRGG